jgi:hypothetical protein
MSDPMAQVHQGGQQPVDDHHPIPGTGSDRPPARPIGQPCVLARLPARAQLGDELSQQFPWTARSLGDRQERRHGPASWIRHDPARPSVTSKPSRRPCTRS